MQCKSVLNELTTAVQSSVEHVFCGRHREENVRRFLSDTAGMPTKDRERVLERLHEAIRVDAD